MKHLLVISFIAFVSACGATDTAQTLPEKNIEVVRSINEQCADLVFAREKNSVGQSNSGYFYAIAQNAEACLSDIQFSPKHQDNALGMQLQALAVTNYVKSGDINSAKQAFENFRAKFPLQDLVYADFTSFVDTAIALLEKDSLSSHQLAMLNINDSLRAEIQRQKTWLRK